MFKPNIGTLNALIRITIGFAMMCFATARLVRMPWCFFSKLAVVLGGMKVAEGIVRFCPVTEAIKLNRYMNIPFMNNGKNNNENNNTTSSNESHNNNGYDASDAKIESDIASAILGGK